MMTPLHRARSVRRWHTNPYLAGSGDTVGIHGPRVRLIIAKLHPAPSDALLTAAETHDDGEWLTGDIPGPAKRKMPLCASEWLEAEERRGRIVVHGYDPMDRITQEDATWLQFADRLDAWQWASRYAPPAYLTGDGWPEQRAWLGMQAGALGLLPDALVTTQAP